VPGCTSDADCVKGYGCVGSACMPLPGKKAGDACAADGDCSSRYCEPTTSVCELQCTRESECPAGQTCFYNPVDTDGNKGTDALHPVCRPQRPGGAAVGTPCTADANCNLGQCQYGVCTVLCSGGGCGAPTACKAGFAMLDDGTVPIKECLPSRGVLEVPLDPSYSWMGVPEHAVSFGLWTQHETQDPNYFTGITSVSDDSGVLFSLQVDLYKNPLRYYPGDGGSMAILSNSPLVNFKPNSVYSFFTFSQTAAGKDGNYSVRARIRVSDNTTLQAGRLAIHVFITNLAGGCYRGTLNAGNAHATLAQFEQDMAQIFAQAQITIDEWKYFDSAAPSTITQAAKPPSPDLDNLLRIATTGDTAQTAELVLVRHIDAQTMPGFEVLGIAGGIPSSSGIPGTAHSGAAVSITPLCLPSGQQQLAFTAAHELGHTMGLFHVVEQDGHTDQITDDDADGIRNLMYWSESSAVGHLSSTQCRIMLHNTILRE
jgi:hypothetical protein